MLGSPYYSHYIALPVFLVVPAGPLHQRNRYLLFLLCGQEYRFFPLCPFHLFSLIGNNNDEDSDVINPMIMIKTEIIPCKPASPMSPSSPMIPPKPIRPSFPGKPSIPRSPPRPLGPITPGSPFFPLKPI